MGEQAQPFSTYRTEVRADWLDYNGHMHDASYAVALSEANEELFAALGLSADYRAVTGASFYTVEWHIRFLASCSLGQSLRAASVLAAADTKRVRVYTELRRQDGEVAATGAALYLHVDTARDAVTPMPAERHRRVQDMLAAHAALPRPAHLGLGADAALPRSSTP